MQDAKTFFEENPWIWAVIGLLLLVVIAAVITGVVIKKKKKSISRPEFAAAYTENQNNFAEECNNTRGKSYNEDTHRCDDIPEPQVSLPSSTLNSTHGSFNIGHSYDDDASMA